MVPERWRGRTVTIAVAVFLGLVVLALLLGSGLRSRTAAGLALFCAGSLSNLFDRAVSKGNVIDFLNIPWGGLRPFIFNLADIAIVAGAALFLFSAAIGVAGWFIRKTGR